MKNRKEGQGDRETLHKNNNLIPRSSSTCPRLSPDIHIWLFPGRIGTCPKQTQALKQFKRKFQETQRSMGRKAKDATGTCNGEGESP